MGPNMSAQLSDLCLPNIFWHAFSGSDPMNLMDGCIAYCNLLDMATQVCLHDYYKVIRCLYWVRSQGSAAFDDWHESFWHAGLFVLMEGIYTDSYNWARDFANNDNIHSTVRHIEPNYTLNKLSHFFEMFLGNAIRPSASDTCENNDTNGNRTRHNTAHYQAHWPVCAIGDVDLFHSRTEQFHVALYFCVVSILKV